MKWRILNLAPWKLAILSGVLVGISFPPLKLGIVVWVGFVPLLRALDQSPPAKSAALIYLAGVTSNIIAIYWLSLNSGAPLPVVFASMIGAVIYLALYWAILGYLFSLIHVRTGKGFFILPFLWVSVEYLMSFGPLGFPWISVATTQVEYLPVIQLVEYTGIYGITFWIILLNIILYRYVLIPSAMKRRLMTSGLLVLVIPWLYGYARIEMVSFQSGEDKDFRIALVQPNVGPHEKWDPLKRNWVFDHLDSMYVEAAKENPQMIVWPESATPFYLRRNFTRLNWVKQRVKKAQIPLLTGAVDWEISSGTRKIYNSVFLIHPDQSIRVYRKIQLVPFGEYNPLSEQFPLSDELSLGHFSPGNSYTVFTVGNVPFSSLICFESAFPQLVRKFVNRGAKILVIVVNDGWFGKTSEPYQHAALARFRAVEHRIPVVRCANTGISAIYEVSGRSSALLPLDSQGIISAGITPRKVLTFYTKFGDLFANISILSVIILGAWFWYREK